MPSFSEYQALKDNCEFTHTCLAGTYKKIERLEKQLSIATKALKGVSLWANTGNGGEKAVKKVCEKALKEMEGVK